MTPGVYYQQRSALTPRVQLTVSALTPWVPLSTGVRTDSLSYCQQDSALTPGVIVNIGPH